MFLDYTKEFPPELCDEAIPYIIEFLADRDLYPIKKLDMERREDHDRRYQRYIDRESKIVPKNGNGAPKMYREEMYNKLSVCDAQFINNLHHYKTCDGGSGYRAEHKHYAMDFIAENPCGPSDRSVLKGLKIYSKNQRINAWLIHPENPMPKMIRRAVSCIDLSPESMITDENREEIAKKRRQEIDFTASIANIDPSFLSENTFGVDTSKLLAEIAMAMKCMIGRVNSQNVPIGDIRISKVLFSTEDHYAYILLDDFCIQKALKVFSSEFEKWFNAIPKERKECDFGGTDRRPPTFYKFVNVVIFLKEFVEEKTAFRRARYICRIPSNEVERLDLYLEIDTGMLRLMETTAGTVMCMPSFWATFPSAIVEVRFWDTRSDELVARHIESIRKMGVAKVTTLDRIQRPQYGPGRFGRPWNTLATAVLQTYRIQEQPTLASIFCAEKDCMGLCQTEQFFKAPKRADDVPTPLINLIHLRDRFHNAVDQNENRVTLSAYIIPYTDAHQNENIPEHYRRLKFVSGFTGTYGTAVVTVDKAMMWTDDMHYRIAQRELNGELWTIMNKSEKKTKTVVQWLRDEMPKGALVGFDPKLMTHAYYLESSSYLASAGVRLTPIASNLVDEFWTARPYREGDPMKIMSLIEAGASPEKKLTRLREALAAQKCTATVITAMDDVMWLLNTRGNDLAFSPLTYSYMFVTIDEAFLFIDSEKIDKDLRGHLTIFKIQPYPYRQAATVIEEWFEKAKKQKNQNPTVYLTHTTNHWLGAIFGEEYSILGKSIVKEIKARKNVQEIGGMRECNLRDSIAMVEFLCWLEREMTGKNRIYSEVECVDKLEAIKRKHVSYEGPSRPTVFSSGFNSAKTGYRPDPSLIVSSDHHYRIQTGGHYKNGTASVTRTTSWSQIEAPPTTKTPPTLSTSPEFIANYTMVLKGHIQVAAQKFRVGVTNGARLEVLVRKTFWMQGYDYEQDIGHNVGHCLNLRDTQGDPEPENDGIVEPNQVISLEPAFYAKDEKYGIQIGNCYETIAVGQEQLLAFRALTLVPIQTSFIVKSMLTPEEILWINQYHFRVFAEIGPLLTKEGKVDELKWLQKACQPI